MGGLQDKTIMDQKPGPELKKEGEDQDKGGMINMIDLTEEEEEPVQEKKIKVVMKEEIIDLTNKVIDLTKEEEGRRL